ncbi:MAG: hypothetical protein VSS75_021310 [Candidatus Parabeggiatoa sp.]|nr:hypothetical protein [Candidatus Parabeggiatoa sp.]
MIKNGVGGANTQTGIIFEDKVDLCTFLNDQVNDYHVENLDIGEGIYFKKDLVATSYKKHELYKFLKSRNVDWKKILSKKLLPDDAVYIIKENTVFILEIKFQQVPGSVDEKLQTCGFKLRQYKRLFSPLNYEVEFIYILNNWFKDDKYKDTLDYIIEMNCKYYFNYLPFDKMGLPVPK